MPTPEPPLNLSEGLKALAPKEKAPTGENPRGPGQRDLAASEPHPTPMEIRSAILDVFGSRAAQAAALGAQERHWPARVTPYSPRAHDFGAAAASAGLEIDLPEGVIQVNAWLNTIDGA